MKELILDGTDWASADDVYDAFFRVVGAPAWHGRNFNALRDSIATGSINQTEVPYSFVIKNCDRIGAGASKMVNDFIDLIHELAAEGCPVQIRAEASDGGSKRSPIQQHHLHALESEFERSLLPVLNECAGGRWGLFGQNEHLESDKYLQWSEAADLKRRAKQIHVLREEFGEPNPMVERFLYYCSLRGPNVPGEPKLARAFLSEIQSGSKMG